METTFAFVTCFKRYYQRLIIYLFPFGHPVILAVSRMVKMVCIWFIEKIYLRYFQPFDHQGPIYTYFIYLPVYLLPWVVFFIPAFSP